MARLGQMPNTPAASPVVLKKLNIKNTVYKGKKNLETVRSFQDVFLIMLNNLIKLLG